MNLIMNNHLKTYIRIIMLMLPLASMTSCSDDYLENGSTNEGTDNFKGEMVLFSAGTTNNVLTGTRAANDGDNSNNNGITETPGKTYYMPDGGRFVCRMYYKTSASSGSTSDPYDVSGNTDITAWLLVNGNAGNSLYWKNTFPNFADVTNKDVYQNDEDATHFYWQNRKEHAFLAWTDINKLNTIGYTPDPYSGSLKFEPEDTIYQKHTGQKLDQWVQNGYEVYCGDENREFETWAELRAFLEEGDNYATQVKDKKPNEIDFTDKLFYYAYGWSCKWRQEVGYAFTDVDEMHRKSGWTEYQMFYDKLPYLGKTNGTNIIIKNDSKEVPAFLYDISTNKYLAQIDIMFYKLDEAGNKTTEVYTPAENDINVRTNATFDKKEIKDGDKIKNADGTTKVAITEFVYNLTDEYGNEKYDEEKPRYVFYYKNLEEKRNQEVIEEYKANVFDLTRKPTKDAEGNITYGINSMSEQPDICQALTKQAPLGATQESNRVNLYFKHQFSQVQVNIKSSADLSVVINKRHIKKVELLGVTEKGFVFTEMDQDGNVEPSTYESVDVSKYDDEHLAKNQYGTSFEMFDMFDENKDNDGYATGYLKSYNALTFGQLQAIRVTWTENEDGTGIVHESTYQVANELLKNLQSGKKYIWNIELRRGTLAIVRTEIVNWIVPTDGTLEYGTDGTIHN